MRNTNTFLLTYTALVFSTLIVLGVLGVDRIDVYVALFMIEFFVISELTSPLGPAESRRKTIIGILMLAIFTGIIVERIAEILR